ncbi:YxeA family protein [Paenibacillus motobuensis]|uniref:YxeA family protein n=1 Tax=Paenibacillus TaxID=44249 RepID=UPI00203DEB8A|nr:MULTISPECIES: YxeA family protein [Paenibacillus]MCM3039763.1 YxeA family protein [Paenibacillus lutimineralis]MCM3646867.1 YxeA family protein [Paenibacillus motobuensis]
MKKGLIIGTSVILVALIGFIVFIQNVNINRLGADSYYVQIQDSGKKIESKSDNGKIYTDYEYTMKGFNEDGKEKTFTFTAQKDLRKQAYLRIYLKGDKVSSYQEVQISELPEKAQQKLEGSGN